MKRLIILPALLMFAACASKPETGEMPTLAVLDGTRIEVKREKVKSPQQSEVIRQYSKFLQDPNSKPLHAQALGKLGDLEMERTEADYLERVRRLEAAQKGRAGETLRPADYRNAIRVYSRLLGAYPNAPGNDRVLYQLAKAYEQSGDREQALAALNLLSERFPRNRFSNEVEFRRGELLFLRGSYGYAEEAYAKVMEQGEQSVYFEKALYKHGWARFKRSRYKPALQSFFSLLDRKQFQLEPEPGKSSPTLARGERELMDDAFRVVALSFAYLRGPKTINHYFKSGNEPRYFARLYTDLGALYLKQQRFADAAGAYHAFIERRPWDPQAPAFQLLAMQAYEQGGFKKPLLSAKEEYVERYGGGSAYWNQRSASGREAMMAGLKQHTFELAQHYHARAQSEKSKADYRKAGYWYKKYIDNYPDTPQKSASIDFLYAESLYESGQHLEAARAYERTAYQYGKHKQGGEAAYGALLAYRQQVEKSRGLNRVLAERQATEAAIKLAAVYPKHPRRLDVLTDTAEQLFKQGDSTRASELANQVVAAGSGAQPPQRKTAWLIIAHVAFDEKSYERSESAYQHALDLGNKNDPQNVKLRERLAASVYKQGETLLAQGKTFDAIKKFRRTAAIAPTQSMRATADYDVATAYIKLKRWPRAIQSLQHFRTQYPLHKLQKQIVPTLAIAYTENRQWPLAAREYETMVARSPRSDGGRDAMWLAATLYEKAGRKQSAMRVYQQYIEQYPRPLEPAIEAHLSIATVYKAAGKNELSRRWLHKIVRAERAGGKQRTERTRTIAAQAMFDLAEPKYAEYSQTRLVRPLKKSLKVKKRKMKEALTAYAAAADYGIADVTTASTYRIAEIYHDLGTGLIKSQRPKGLSKEELVQYDILLEEQAFPFEEKAIKIHEANRARATDGIYNDWVKKSFKQLGRLQPVRYGKSERSERVIREID